MENISKILLYLMACSIQSIKPEDKVLVGADLEKLLQTAKAHSVSAMVCMALEQTDTFRNAEESTRLKWIDAKNKAGKISCWIQNVINWKKNLQRMAFGICR